MHRRKRRAGILHCVLGAAAVDPPGGPRWPKVASKGDNWRRKIHHTNAHSATVSTASAILDVTDVRVRRRRVMAAKSGEA